MDEILPQLMIICYTKHVFCIIKVAKLVVKTVYQFITVLLFMFILLNCLLRNNTIDKETFYQELIAFVVQEGRL